MKLEHLTDKQIAYKLQRKDIPNLRNYQKENIVHVDKPHWGEEQTKSFEKEWIIPRVFRLPRDDLLKICSLSLPLSPHLSWTQPVPYLTTEQGLQTIIRILDAHNIPKGDEDWRRYSPSPLCVACTADPEGIIVPYSWSGDTMGDGNMLQHVCFVPYERKILACDFVLVHEEIVHVHSRTWNKSFSDGKHQSYSTEQKQQVQSQHYARQLFQFCENHLDNAETFLRTKFAKANKESLGVFDDNFKNSHREQVSQKEILQAKTKLICMNAPELIYDLAWINDYEV